MKRSTTVSKLNQSLADGWAIHIYDRNRRLLCTLEPLHGWIFAAGIGVGLVLALALSSMTVPSAPRPVPQVSPTMTAPLQVD